jgi:hypothetical protein
VCDWRSSKVYQYVNSVACWNESETTPERQTMSQNKFPPGWDEERVKTVLMHYEEQSEDEAVAEDEAAYEEPNQTVMEVPTLLVPVIRELIAKNQA